MKYNIIFALAFISIMYADIKISSGRIGATRLAPPQSQGCKCHTLTEDVNVMVSITGPDTLHTGETATYRVSMSGGPAIAGGFNAAARYGLLSVIDTNTIKYDPEITHNAPLLFNGDTLISWTFSYTAPDSSSWDTIYSIGLSVNYDTYQNSEDKWNFSPNFPVRIEAPVPVELVSFTVRTDENNLLLNWETATENNNRGFEIYRKTEISEEIEWDLIGFAAGNGTTPEKKSYTFFDKNLANGRYYYRLKQIDFDGSFEYSEIASAEVIVKGFSLEQNYPNPFNPSATIDFSIPFDAKVTLKLFSVTGEELSTFSEENFEAGSHSIKISSEGLASGIYIYSLRAEASGNIFSQSRKMIVMK